MKLTLEKKYDLQSPEVLPKDFEQKNVPPTFSHGKRRWGKGLRTIINEGIAITTFQKINTYIAKQCSHVEIPDFVMGSHLGQ
jgi:hypothetical protein